MNEAGNWSTKFTTPGAFWATNPTWYEGYGKISYNVTDTLALGVNAFFTQSYLDFGAAGKYFSGTAKYTIGDFALSGEFGRQLLGRTDAAHDVSGTAYLSGGAAGLWKRDLPDYNYWNAGVSYNYKMTTLDLRYHGSDLSKTECGNITGQSYGAAMTTARGSQSTYCGTRLVGTISFALTGKDLK